MTTERPEGGGRRGGLSPCQSSLICFHKRILCKINRQPPAVLKPELSIKTLRSSPCLSLDPQSVLCEWLGLGAASHSRRSPRSRSGSHPAELQSTGLWHPALQRGKSTGCRGASGLTLAVFPHRGRAVEAPAWARWAERKRLAIG